MKKSQLAQEHFRNCNCSQAVLRAFSADLGLDEQTAMKLASGFGGGMACGETCGAVTGAYMVIGLKHGHTDNSPEAKARTKALIRRFNELFITAHGDLHCKVLLGVDTSTPEGHEKARELNLFETRCPHFIAGACDILEANF